MALAALPADFEARLAGVVPSGGTAAALRLLGPARDGFAAGESPDLGLLVPLAVHGYNQLGDLCQSLDEATVRAAIDGSD